MQQCVIYIRTNREQDIFNQLNRCLITAYVNKLKVANVYTDIGLKENFHSMLGNIHKYDYLLVYDHSRISRKMEEYLDIASYLRSKNVKIISAQSIAKEDFKYKFADAFEFFQQKKKLN